jgi:hypothetical protein
VCTDGVDFLAKLGDARVLALEHLRVPGPVGGKLVG